MSDEEELEEAVDGRRSETPPELITSMAITGCTCELCANEIIFVAVTFGNDDKFVVGVDVDTFVADDDDVA